MADKQSASLEPCEHCFCRQDTGGNWVCCKCGKRLMDVVSISYIPVPTTSTPIAFPPNTTPYLFPVQHTAGGIIQFRY